MKHHRTLAARLALIALCALLCAPCPARARNGAQRLYLCAKHAANEDCLGTALHLVDRAIALDPGVGEYHRLRGFLLRDIGDERGAVRELEKARLSGQAVAARHASEELYELGVDHHSVPLDLGSESPATPAQP